MVGVDLGLRPWAPGRAAPAASERVERDALERVGRERPERLLGPGGTRRRCGPRSAIRVWSTLAASWNVLHSSSRASRRSRSSKRSSSSSRSTSSRPGSSRRAFSSTSVAAISRNSVAPSRSTRSICSTSAQNASTIRASEISQRSTSSLRMRCSRRSNGPSKTGVETSYGTAANLPAANHSACGTARNRPGQTGLVAGILGPHGEGVLGHQAHRRDAARQLPRGGPPLGRRPAAPGSPAAERHDAIFCVVDLHAMTVPYDPAELTDADPPARHVADGRRARPRPLPAVRAEPRARPHRAHLGPQLHRHVRRAAPHDAVQGEVGQGQGVASSVGLFDYPVLMAADILLYDTDEVPVGDDQRQHVELTRDIAIRFNHHFGDTFVVPKATFPRSARASWTSRTRPRRCRSRTTRRRARSVLDEDPKTIAKKIKSAVTDSDTEVRHDRDAKPGHLEPHRDLRRGRPARRSPTSRRSSPGSSTARSRPRSPTRSSSSSGPCRNATRELDSRSRRGRPPARARRRHRGRQGRIGARVARRRPPACFPARRAEKHGFGDRTRAIAASSVAKTQSALAVGAARAAHTGAGIRSVRPARPVVVRACPRDRLGPRAGVFEQLGAELGVTQVRPPRGRRHLPDRRGGRARSRRRGRTCRARSRSCRRRAASAAAAQVSSRADRRGKPFERRDRFGPVGARHLRPHLELGRGQLRPHRSDRGGVGLARAQRPEEPAHEVQRCTRSRHHSAADEVEQPLEERVEQAADPVGRRTRAGTARACRRAGTGTTSRAPRRAGRVRAAPSRRAAGSATG